MTEALGRQGQEDQDQDRDRDRGLTDGRAPRSPEGETRWDGMGWDYNR